MKSVLLMSCVVFFCVVFVVFSFLVLYCLVWSYLVMSLSCHTVLLLFEVYLVTCANSYGSFNSNVHVQQGRNGQGSCYIKDCYIKNWIRIRVCV